MAIVSWKWNYTLLFLPLLLFSCIGDDFDKLQQSNWDPEFAIPLVDSRIGIDRLVGKYNNGAGFVTDDDNVVVIVYEGNVLDIGADSLIKLDDISFDLAPLQNLGIVNYPSPNFLLKTLEFKAGLLRIHIEDDISTDTRVTLSLPKTIKNGSGFREIFTLPFKGASITSFDTIFDISDYVMDLSGSGNSYNQLDISYSAFKAGTSDSVEIDQFIISFEQLEYSFIDGNLGNIDLGSHGDTMKLEMFDNFKSGRIVLEDPVLSLNISNTFGLPINLNISNISGSGSNGNSSLSGDAIDDGIKVPSADSKGDSASLDKDIDKTNSNISQFLSITPDVLSFLFDLQANANGDTASYNFVTDKSRLKGDLLLQIPMKGSMDSVIIEDLYAFSKDNLTGIKEATFKMVTDNSFPLGIYVQIYFLDAENNVLDSLTNTGTALFREANTDADGYSNGIVREESYFPIGSNRFENIRDRVENLKIRVMLLTDDSKHKIIKIRSTDYFDLKLGVRAKRN